MTSSTYWILLAFLIVLSIILVQNNLIARVYSHAIIIMFTYALDYESRKGLRQVCEATLTIDAPIEMVWSAVSSFGGIKLWMPALRNCHVLEDKPQPPALGAVRRVVSGDGATVDEHLEIWDLENHLISYRLESTPMWPIKCPRGCMRLSPANKESTLVCWSVDGEDFTEGNRLKLAAVLEPFMRSSLEELNRLLTRVA